MMPTGFPRTIGVVGLGLMGASLAMGVRRVRPGVRLLAIEPRGEVRTKALAAGMVDEALAAPGDALAACELVVLCTPVPIMEEILEPVARLLPDGAVLTDVGGTKERLVALARERVRAGVAFVGAHPLFGGHGGLAGASAEKWLGGTVAVCTDGAPEAVEQVAALHTALGARVQRCTAAEHDAAVATVSHLPHLLAAALAGVVREGGPVARSLAGAALRDMTRLAAFPFDVEGELARRNAHLREAVARLERRLEAIVAAVGDSPEAARNALEAARAAREELA